jgi:hypothetical protein
MIYADDRARLPEEPLGISDDWPSECLDDDCAESELELEPQSMATPPRQRRPRPPSGDTRRT